MNDFLTLLIYITKKAGIVVYSIEEYSIEDRSSGESRVGHCMIQYSTE